MAPPRTGVLISYARSDGEALARDLYLRLQTEGIPLWRDLDRLEGGRDWWLQIESALNEVEFMVLVMTPAAAESAVVRKEWRYARQRGVCVYPVKGVTDLDFDALPRWMRTLHFYDLDREWLKFVNDLRTRCVQRRVPFMAEDLPAEFVARPAEYERLLSHLLDRQRDEPIAITTAIRAAGGYGKNVLARALCHDEEVQNAFDDGVLWVTLGENPGDLTGRIADLIYFLSGQRPSFSGVEAATALFVELLAERDILLIIDDVWDPAHLKPFIQGGPRCARVITTRAVDTLPSGTARVDVDAMQPPEALALGVAEHAARSAPDTVRPYRSATPATARCASVRAVSQGATRRRGSLEVKRGRGRPSQSLERRRSGWWLGDERASVGSGLAG